MKRAIYPGSFDPFTLGHKSLVDRFLCVFDELVIAIGVNDVKSTFFSLNDRISMIESLYDQDDRVKVLSYNSLTVDFAKFVDAKFIVRGIRSTLDFEYEKSIADVNRKISGIETLFFMSEPQYLDVSSSVVRELLKYKHSISDFVPKEIEDAINII